MTKPPTQQQLYDLGIQPLIYKYGQNLALTFVLACTQHRTGRQYDAWAWSHARDTTAEDVEMARQLLRLAKSGFQPEPPTGEWVTPE